MKTWLGVLAFSCLVLFVSADFVSAEETAESRAKVVPDYKVVRFKSPERNVEQRVFYKDQHFLSIILDINKALAIRPHPGTDKDGWGPTAYPGAFLPGATLRRSRVSVKVTKTGVSMKASGIVSYGAKKSFGTWKMAMDFSFDSLAAKILGTGTYDIKLKDFLSSNTGDLNLCKIADNRLVNVPLQGGGAGNTGDMKQADVSGDFGSFTWIPEDQPACFPTESLTSTLTINVVGNYNNIDTAAQGLAPINAAYKPSISLTYTSETSGIPMIFGAIFDTTKATDFWSDNVGITPLVLKSSTAKKYSFNVTFGSTAPHFEAQLEAVSSPSTVAAELISVNNVLFCRSNFDPNTSINLWKSEDSGASWIPVAFPGILYPPSYVSSLAVDAGKLYVGTDQGLLVSEDMGANFSYSFPWGWDTTTDVDFHNGYGWITVNSWGSQSGVLKKEPGGTWTYLGPWDSAGTVVADPIDPANIAYAEEANHGDIRTLDGGNTWVSCDHWVRFATIINGKSVAFGRGFYTEDHGETWKDMGLNSPHFAQLWDYYVRDEASGLIFAGGMDCLYAGLPGNWNLCKIPNTKPDIKSIIASLAISGKYLFVLLDDGTISRTDITNITTQVTP